MYLVPIAFSYLLAASSVAALGSPHDLAGRLAKAHGDLARDIKISLERASFPVLADNWFKKRAATTTKQWCRVKPTNALNASTDSLTSPARHPPTATSSITRATSTGASSTSASPTGTKAPIPTSPWKLKVTNEGNTFFDGWDFWSTSDPTHGMVDYQDQSSAWNNKLIEINSAGNAILRVETTPTVSGNRKSIRLHNRNIFNGGLLIFDAVHMPVGCGTWPAFWTNGPDWPNKGEIDIVEGVHNGDTNQVSIHTSSGCTISASPDVYNAVGTLNGGPNCASAETGNSGCGMQDNFNDNSYGARFNKAGGGVYAMKWDDSGISVYFFSRDKIPQDITNGAPLPDTWPKPIANYPATTCNPWQFFKDNFAILNTTICGDWAGSPGAWTGSGCAASTGFSTCEQFARQNGQAYNDAYWEVKSVRFYQTS